MTRFARAKGSKSSNERHPEEATSWATMKQQLLEKNNELEENRKRKDMLDKRNNIYKAFLKEKESEELGKTKWSEFPGVTKPKAKTIKEKQHKKAINNFLNSSDGGGSDDGAFNELKAKIDRVLEKQENVRNGSDSVELPEEQSSNIKNKKLKRKVLKVVVDKEKALKEKENETVVNGDMISESQSTENKKGKVKLKKKNTNNTMRNIEPKPTKKNSKNVESGDSTKIKQGKKNKIKNTDSNENVGEKVKSKKNSKNLTGADSTKTHKIDKKTKTKSVPVKKVLKENLTEEELKIIEKKKQKKLRQLEKRKKKKAELKIQAEQKIQNEQNKPEGDTGSVNHNNENNKTYPKPKKPLPPKKPGKVRDNLQHPRRKPYLPNKMMINGKEIEVEYIDGFAVMKDDAIRLKKLRKEMITKGLPRSEINHALKLERRKAEKAFAREKKNVCFNCRKSGHNLSECPELNKDQVAPTSGGGICFKCGSTEHTHFECKVVRGQNFNYATCFVCNEQGHIARQCPDNPKGLYPKGGACKVCGNVTHLKKDCPQYQAQQQKQDETFRIGTYGDSNPDALDDTTGNNVPVVNRRPNKIVKF